MELKEAGTYKYETGTVTILRPVLTKEEHDKKEQEFKDAVARYARTLKENGYEIGRKQNV